MTRAAASIAVGVTLASLALSAPAGARPGNRTFQHTYPIASRLCARTAAGHAPKRLQGQEAQVAQDCTTLETAYSQAVSAALQAQATFRAGRLSANAQLRQSCRQAHISHDRSVCQAARAQHRAQMMSLRQARRSAFASYHAAIESARQAFWSAIHALRGGADIAPDQPQPNAPVPGSGQ